MSNVSRQEKLVWITALAILFVCSILLLMKQHSILQSWQDLDAISPNLSLLSSLIKWRSGNIEHKLHEPNNTEDIPSLKIIHMVYGLWDDEPIPQKYVAFIDKWKLLHKGVNVQIHDRDECEKLVRERFPHLTELYFGATPIQRSDLLRVLFVYEYGGLYSDLDVNPSVSIYDIWRQKQFTSNDDLLVFVEITLDSFTQIASISWPLRNGIPEIKTRIANFVFYASRPRIPALLSVIHLITYRLHRISILDTQVMIEDNQYDTNYETIYTTGPDAFTEALFGAPRLTLHSGIVVADAEDSFPNTGWSSWKK